MASTQPRPTPQPVRSEGPLAQNARRFYTQLFAVLFAEGRSRTVQELTACLLALSLPPGVTGDREELLDHLDRCVRQGLVRRDPSSAEERYCAG